MNVLDLFSGIGGFSLGLERAGMRTIGFCEIDAYCRAVLRKHWPNVPIHDDIRTYAGLPCDVMCGGFPCQDVSEAGARGGIDASRSGLWREFARLIREVRPSYALVENTPGLLERGMGRVIGDLAEIGYDAEWHCLPAAIAGARHLRERVFIIASAREMGNASFITPRYLKNASQVGRWQALYRIRSIFDGTSWAGEPAVDRVAYGVPGGALQTSRLGNAVLPAIAEIAGKAIMSRHSQSAKACDL